VAGNDGICAINQNGIRKTKGFDAGGNLADLVWRVCPGVAGMSRQSNNWRVAAF
jgi:hypothetical protein